MVAVAVGLALLTGICAADNGLRFEFYKDTTTDYGEFGSDTSFPQPYWQGISSNIDFVFNDEVNQHFSARWEGYLYVPTAKAGDITFKTVTDDGVRLYIGGSTVIDKWRLQSHQTIGTPSDECTHEATVNLSAGYHSIKFEYFEWDGGEDDPDPCKLYWDGTIIPSTNLFTEIPPSSNLAITNVSHSPSPFNPSASQTTTISYSLSVAADVTIELYDTDDSLVRTLIDDASRSSGANSEDWDGKDDSGTIVADGPYRYVITATAGGDTVVYDPGSGGLPEVTDFTVDDFLYGYTTDVSYTLPIDCIVRIRIGTEKEWDEPAMLRTLVNWEYRAAGFNDSDSWDGRDDSGNQCAPNEYLGCIWALPIATNAIVVEGGN
jgi:flagellar hook assembly protein FlgD